MRRKLRGGPAIEEIHDKWVADDRIGAENIAEDLVKANRASLMGLERAEADAAADLARRRTARRSRRSKTRSRPGGRIGPTAR